MNRRTMLKTVAAAGAATIIPSHLFGQAPMNADWRGKILRYLESLARPDGGYAWEDQEQSHLTPTFAVVGCYHALGQTPPNKTKLAEFIRTHHPRELKKLAAFASGVVRSLMTVANAGYGADPLAWRDGAPARCPDGV